MSLDCQLGTAGKQVGEDEVSVEGGKSVKGCRGARMRGTWIRDDGGGRIEGGRGKWVTGELPGCYLLCCPNCP